MAIVTVIVCLAALLYLIQAIWNRRKSTLPHPKGVPIFGNLFQFNREKPYLLLAQWAKELGPLFRVRMLNHDMVILSDYDTLHEALLKKGQDFAGRPFNYGNRSKYVWENGTSIFMNNPGPQWKFLRNTLHTNVKMYESGLKEVENINMSIIAEMVKTFRAKSHKPFNPKTDLYNAIMNIICVFLVGKKYSQDDQVFKLFKEVERQTKTLLGTGSKGSELEVMWWLRHFGNKHFKQLENLRNLRRQLWALAKKDVEERKEQGSEVNHETTASRGIVGKLLDALQERDQGKSKVPDCVTEMNVMLTFQDLIFAGTTTTANSFYAFLNILVNYPQVQNKLREEVDDVIGENQPASLSNKNNMTYTRATILELLRYTSIVPLGVIHAAIKDTELKGHFIPKGTMVVLNLWALHHDKEFWKDPYVFRPERFLDDDGDLLPPDHDNRKHLMPFSAGTRVCLGESLAQGRLFLLVTTMVQMFIIKVGSEEVSCDPMTYEPGSVASQSDYKIQLVVRNNKLFL